MVPEGGRLRRRSPACTSGAAAEAREHRLRWGGSGAEAPLALRGFGRRSTACPAEGGSGAGIPLVLRRDGSGAGTSLALRRGGSSAGISHGLRRDDSSQEPRLRPEGGGWAYEAGLRSGGWGAGAPLLLRELLGSRCCAARQPRRERLPVSARTALRPTRAQRGPAPAAPEAAASSHPAQGVRLVTRTRPAPPPPPPHPHPHPHPAPTRRTPTAAPAPAPPSSAVPGSGGRGLRR